MNGVEFYLYLPSQQPTVNLNKPYCIKMAENDTKRITLFGILKFKTSIGQYTIIIIEYKS
jgi:hypothetical protein